MNIDAKVVRSIAELAQLDIPEAQLEDYVSSLSNILDLVEDMQAVDTTGIEPMSNPLDAVQRLREDLVTEVDQRSEFQSIAPATENGFYLVPKVIE